VPTRSAPLRNSSNPNNIVAAIVVLVLIVAGAGLALRQSSSAFHGGAGSDRSKDSGGTAKGRDPVAASDPTAVEPADIIRQAIARAKRIDPSAKLVGAHFPELINGLVDLSRNNWANYNAFVKFEYRRIDSSKPPGEDVIQGGFNITAKKNGFGVWAHSKGHATKLTGSYKAAFPLPIPRCTAKQAWKVAIESGVPSNAKTNVHWGKVNPFEPDQQTQWSFTVKGHNKYRREIDATTCTLLRTWDASGNVVRPSKSRAAPPPRRARTTPRPKPIRPKPTPRPTTPKPQKTGNCGCAKTDLMCAMRCSKR